MVYSDVVALASEGEPYLQAAYQAETPLLQLFQQAFALWKVPLLLAPAGCYFPLAVIFVLFELELHDERVEEMD